MMRVKAGIFSLTPSLPPDDDGSYLRWHLLDHLPEQFQLPGIQHALRYIADGAYLGARIAGVGPLADVGGVMNYLVGDPVQQTHDNFMELGARLRELGRFPAQRPSLQLRMPALLRWYAAPRVLVSAEVVPWRPHRGVLLLVEAPTAQNRSEWLHWLHSAHHPALLEVPGVAGVWLYSSTDTWTLHPHCRGAAQYITVVYLDEDPITVAAALVPLLEQRWASGAVRPLFAGPLRTMIEWEALR